MAELPTCAREWLQQVQRGSVAVVAVQDAELGALDDRRALARSDALLSMSVPAPLSDRVVSSGFVEQQRLFMRARR